jgi:hypothetical protein
MADDQEEQEGDGLWMSLWEQGAEKGLEKGTKEYAKYRLRVNSKKRVTNRVAMATGTVSKFLGMNTKLCVVQTMETLSSSVAIRVAERARQ